MVWTHGLAVLGFGRSSPDSGLTSSVLPDLEEIPGVAGRPSGGGGRDRGRQGGGGSWGGLVGELVVDWLRGEI
jgi:hypothetical protein